MSELITPASFASDHPPERIIGTETEHHVRRYPSGTDENWLPDLFSAEALKATGLNWYEGSHANLWLSNGPRVYRDVQNVLEYAAPESLGPMEATLTTHAAPLILRTLVEQSGVDYRIFRRGAVVDPESGAISTLGFHPNFCIPDTLDEEVSPVLETLLATQFYASGGIATKGQGFNILPKSIGIGNHIGVFPSNQLRAEHKAFGFLLQPSSMCDKDTNDPRFRLGRFEDRSKAPSSPWSEFMGHVTTSLILRVLEHPQLCEKENQELKNLALINSIRTFKAAGWDMRMKNIYRIRGGREVTALDIQESMAQIALSASEKMRLPADERYGLQEWLHICDDYRAIQKDEADFNSIADRVGWASKYMYLVRKFGVMATHDGDIDVLRACLGWDRIVSKGGGQIYAEKLGIALAREADCAHYTQTAPAQTRAHIRGEQIRKGRVFSVNWASIRVSGMQLQAPLHPYQTSFAA